MKEFLDRIPAQGKVNRKKITYSDDSEEYVFIENADEPEEGEEGTTISRNNLMAIQGFQNNDIVITENNNTITIVETNGDNEVSTTTISENVDGSTVVVETFVGEKTITKTTTINALGNIISEVLS